MNILFSSYAFPPSVGGIETVSAILVEQFADAGHHVTIVTETAGPEKHEGLFVLRRPGLRRLLPVIRSADVVFQNNISLRVLLPALVLRKPVVVLHQTWLRGADGGLHWNDRLKRLALPFVTNAAISRAVAADLDVRCEIIPNPFRTDVFRVTNSGPRPRTLVFVGRLVSDKGADLLLEALAALHRDGLEVDLTIVGEGPERPVLEALSRELNLDHCVTFAGIRQGEELGRLLNEHQIMVVPSRWPEPFGVVALEGLASGCVVIGSAEGGLAEAIGPAGITFPNGRADLLAAAVRRVLYEPGLAETLRQAAEGHLPAFSSQLVARRHLELMESVVS